MQIDKQVTNLEISKQLEEIGVKRDAIFYWEPFAKRYKLYHYGDQSITTSKAIAAYTVSELGEMLPEFIKIEKAKGLSGWNVFYTHEDISKGYSCGADTLADAMGKMLIYLINQGLINKEKINERNSYK